MFLRMKGASPCASPGIRLSPVAKEGERGKEGRGMASFFFWPLVEEPKTKAPPGKHSVLSGWP